MVRISIRDKVGFEVRIWILIRDSIYINVKFRIRSRVRVSRLRTSIKFRVIIELGYIYG